MTGNCVISLSYLILSSEGLHYSFRKGSESKQRSRERKRDTVWHQPILNSFPLAQFSAAWVLAALFPKANFCTVVRAQELLLHKKLPLGHAAAAAECSTTHRKIDCAFSLLFPNPKVNLTSSWYNAAVFQIGAKNDCWPQMLQQQLLRSINCFCIAVVAKEGFLKT